MLEQIEDHMDEEYYCLKWNDHNSNMLRNFENLLRNEELCDVTIACDGSSMKAHKLVLSASSPFFHKLFLDNPSSNPIVILSDLKYADLKTLIDFMYHGHINVSENQLSAILKAAENLKIKGLGNCMEQLLNDNQSSALRTKPNLNANNSDSETGSNVSSFKDKAERIHTDHSYVEEAASFDQQSEMYFASNSADADKLNTPCNEERQVEFTNTFDSHLDINPSKLMEQSMTTEDEYTKKLFMENSPKYESFSCDTSNKNTDYDSVHIKLPLSVHSPEMENSNLGLSQSYQSSEGSSLQLATFECLTDSSKRGRKPGSRLCVLCKHVFHSDSEYKTHMNNHRSTSSCDDTDLRKLPEPVEFNDSLPVTEKNILKLPLLCSTCSYVMNTLSDAQSHLSSNPNCRTSQFKCLLCPKLFIWPATLMKHFREQHEGPGGITRVARRMWYFCDVCKKPLLSKHALSLHRSKLHGLNQPINTSGTEENLDNCKRGRKRGTRVCGICKRTFLGSDYFTHVQTVHKNISLSDSSVDASTYMNESISMDNESNSTQSAA